MFIVVGCTTNGNGNDSDTDEDISIIDESVVSENINEVDISENNIITKKDIDDALKIVERFFVSDSIDEQWELLHESKTHGMPRQLIKMADKVPDIAEYRISYPGSQYAVSFEETYKSRFNNPYKVLNLYARFYLWSDSFGRKVAYTMDIYLIKDTPESDWKIVDWEKDDSFTCSSLRQ